jgi:hypothetical protein
VLLDHLEKATSRDAGRLRLSRLRRIEELAILFTGSAIQYIQTKRHAWPWLSCRGEAMPDRSMAIFHLQAKVIQRPKGAQRGRGCRLTGICQASCQHRVS